MSAAFKSGTNADIVLVAEMPKLEMATAVMSSSFGKPNSVHLHEDVQRHLLEGDLVYTIRTREKPLIGYAIFRIFDPVLYLAGIVLEREMQGRGIAQCVVSRARADSGLSCLGLRTQSVRMWAAGKRMTLSWIPDPHVAQGNTMLTSIGHRLAARLSCDFPVTVGFYGAPLYGAKPLCREAELQNWWDSLCDYGRGDAVICVGELA